MKKTEYKIIFSYIFKNGRKQKTKYEAIVSESELDFIKSFKDRVFIYSVTKIEE